MQIKTFDEVLTEVCDFFDTLISPKSISRSNTNVIYLMFKAIAKGYEVIHNLVVALSNKYNPALCSDEDLESTAFLVGTERLKGSYSGLAIKIMNDGDTSAIFPSGTFYYELNADTKFYFNVKNPITINSGAYKQLIALTDKVGTFPVTQQTSISVQPTNDAITVPSDFSFSCTDNKPLLGTSPESSLEFRKRILTNVDRQDVIRELEFKIKNLPYIFDCLIRFNETLDSVTIGDITVPPYYMLIIIAGEMRDEVAEIVASNGIYPTVIVDNDKYVEYENDVFSSGSYKVYYTEFGSYDYSVNIMYEADENFITGSVAEETIRNFLLDRMNSNVRQDTVTENDIYNALEELNLEGVKVLSVELYVNSSRTQYISVPETSIASLTSVTFSNGD